MAGRKKIPEKLKVVAGTSRSDRVNDNAPAANPGVADLPETLSSRGAELFASTSAILDGMGIASPDDVSALTMLAMRLEQVEVLTVQIEDGGYTYKTDGGLWKANPAVAQRSDAMRHAQSLLAEFGLTPAARAKVSAGKPAEKNPFGMLG